MVMNTTTATRLLTTSDLDAFEQDDEWAGFGYIGARRNAREAIESGEWDEPMFVIEQADDAVLMEANRRKWTAARLFTWANSKSGRWAGDLLLASDLSENTGAQLRKLMDR